MAGGRETRSGVVLPRRCGPFFAFAVDETKEPQTVPKIWSNTTKCPLRADCRELALR